MDVTPEDDSANEAALPFVSADWPHQATARLVDIIDTIPAKTGGPAIRISRAIVYGLVVFVLILIALPLLLIGLTRLLIGSLDSGLFWVIPGVEHDKAVWIAYLSVGALSTIIGFALWMRRPRHAAEPARAA